MNLILFDTPERESLYPITFTRPVAGIRLGAFTIKEKWEQELGGKASYLTDDYLSKKFTFGYQKENLYLNGAVLPDGNMLQTLTKLNEGQVLMSQNIIIAFHGGAVSYAEIREKVLNLERVDYKYDLQIIRNTWDLISFLKKELMNDLAILSDRYPVTELPDWVSAKGKENIRIGKDVVLENCILNASNGPIFIDEGAEVMDGAILRGPVYIGKHSVVKMAAKIYGPFACGPQCRIGGEVSDTQIQGYSNKGHDGFLGHSYLGEWCNLGADTNISNLKNSYEMVRLWNYQTQRFEHTRLQFLGLIMGDHSKTGINTMINSGTVVGVASNLFGAGYPRNFVPSFVEGGYHGFKPFSKNCVYKMARSMMARRNMDFSQVEQEIIENVNLLDIHSRRVQ
jgi:UDP-N-acetylglucosamine diphosphorylase/glucosamine-1-phosphate N-acetyltransferase